VKAIGSNVSGVAQLADLHRLYRTVSKAKGRVDIVFANAGVGEFVPFGAVTEEHFDKLFQHQCERNPVHGSKGLAAIEGHWLHHS
jgi:NAD(P)-dependent dehydrogenase (short-subunit alcohol dehydrogenase family)